MQPPADHRLADSSPQPWLLLWFLLVAMLPLVLVAVQLHDGAGEQPGQSEAGECADVLMPEREQATTPRRASVDGRQLDESSATLASPFRKKQLGK